MAIKTQAKDHFLSFSPWRPPEPLSLASCKALPPAPWSHGASRPGQYRPFPPQQRGQPRSPPRPAGSCPSGRPWGCGAGRHRGQAPGQLPPPRGRGRAAGRGQAPARPGPEALPAPPRQPGAAEGRPGQLVDGPSRNGAHLPFCPWRRGFEAAPALPGCSLCLSLLFQRKNYLIPYQ